MPKAITTPTEDIAVIDVGSNSVRMVVFHVEGRAIWPVFNEKLMAGLGQDLSKTGKLSPDGVERAMAVLRRFRVLLDRYEPTHIYAVATAAVRDARDGQDFLRRVEDETQIPLQVISGGEEARLSALGVIAGDPDADGLAADLGGASLELIELADRQPQSGVTLPLGPFSLEAEGLSQKRARTIIQHYLDALPLQFQAKTLYAVGGAWRNLALVHMHRSEYPLHIVHNYRLPADEIEDLVKYVRRARPATLEAIPNFSKKRLPTLPYAAVLLDELMKYLGADEVQLSAYGLREGLVFDHLDAEVQAADPLLAGAQAMGQRTIVSQDLGEALQRWIAPAFEKLPPVMDPERERIVRAAACRMADMGARLHTDHRGSLVFGQVLRAPFAGVSHMERAFIAAALFHRHASRNDPPEMAVLTHLLNPAQMSRAKALGFAMRLGCDVSGRAAVFLQNCELKLRPQGLLLQASPKWADMLLGDTTQKRLGQLGEVMGLPVQIL